MRHLITVSVFPLVTLSLIRYCDGTRGPQFDKGRGWRRWRLFRLEAMLERK